MSGRPPGYPRAEERRLVLKDGSAVLLRPILPADEPLLVELFERLSPQARYLRFLSHLPALPPQILHQLTHVDYRTEFALVAVVVEAGREAIVAVGRYAFDPEEEEADLAVAVRDDWQQQGLGKLLLTRVIAFGKAQGLYRFGSMMEPQNSVVKQMLAGLGYEVHYFFRDGAFQVRIVA